MSIQVVGNKTPIALADTERVDNTDPVFGNVRSNDRDPDGDPLLVVVATGTTRHGSFVRISDGCTYQATEAFTAIDVFDYTIDDGQGGTATATVAVTLGLRHRTRGVRTCTGLGFDRWWNVGDGLGIGFTGASAVAFGSAPGSDVVVVSDSEITATSPAGLVGDVFVTVTAPSGTPAPESPDAVFTYEASRRCWRGDWSV